MLHDYESLEIEMELERYVGDVRKARALAAAIANGVREGCFGSSLLDRPWSDGEELYFEVMHDLATAIKTVELHENRV